MPTYAITTFGGGGFPENIPATSANLGPIGAMAVDPSGNIYLALTNFHVIERVGQDGILTRFVGNGTSGFSGDGGPATQAQISPAPVLRPTLTVPSISLTIIEFEKFTTEQSRPWPEAARRPPGPQRCPPQACRSPAAV